MTRFEGTFRGRTTGGGPGVKITAGGVLMLAGGAYVLTHRHQAGQDAGTAAVVTAVVLGVILAAVITFGVALLIRSRRGNPEGAPSPLLCRVSPQPVPARETPRAIAAPAAPEIHIHLGPDLAAYFREREAAPVCRVTAEPVEHQEIDR
jgi:hypothetical protein